MALLKAPMMRTADSYFCDILLFLMLF